MLITVEFLLTHESEIHDVGRIPCIGEHVILNDEAHEVKAVMHILDSLTAIKAIVRVK